MASREGKLLLLLLLFLVACCRGRLCRSGSRSRRVPLLGAGAPAAIVDCALAARVLLRLVVVVLLLL